VRSFRPKAPPQLVAALLLGVAASVSIFGILLHYERFRAESNFEQLALQRLSSVRTRVTGALDTINLVASHFEASRSTSRESFRTLVAPVLARHRYLQALEWIPRVPRQDRAAYERSGRLDGAKGFQFTERTAGRRMAPAADRPQYFPVFYVEPLAGNEQALGYDLASDRVRLEALNKAGETGNLVATARVVLVQEKGNQYGVLVFAPAYNRDGSRSAGTDRKELKGLALAVLRVGDLIEGANDGRGEAAGVEIHVFDTTNSRPEQLYPKTPEIALATLRSGLHVEEPLEVEGRAWEMIATSRVGASPWGSLGAYLELVFGLAVTGVFALHLRAKAKQSEEMAEVVEELKFANQQLEAHAAEIAEQGRLAALGSDMGVVLTKRDDLASMLQGCVAVLVEHLDAALARIWTLSEDGNVLELQASAGIYTHIDGGHARVQVGTKKIGHIAQDRRPYLSNHVMGDPEVCDQDWAQREGMVAFAGYPLIVEDRLVGVTALFARRPLADSTLKALASIADEIALGIERKKAEEALRESEQRFRLAAENGSDVIVVRDLVNERMLVSGDEQRLLPYAGKMPRSFAEFKDLLHPEDRDRVQAAVEAHLRLNAPYRQEFRVLDHDGAIRHWSARATAIRNANGEPTQLVIVTTDITERKKTEAALSQLAAIVESSEASILSIDLAGTILTWNPAAERIYGYSADEIKGRSAALIYPRDRQGELKELLRKMQSGDGVQHIETVRVRKDGKSIPVFATYSPLRQASGRVIGACSIATDITERKLLERQLAQAQKLESIGQLAAGIAHEINTPIQYVGDNLRFLRDSFVGLEELFTAYDRLLEKLGDQSGECPFVGDVQALAKATRVGYLREEIPQSIEDALDGAGRVAEIVRAIKEFSHPGPLEKTPLNINRAIESTVLVSRNEWKYVADLHTDLDEDLPPVACVAGEFNQVILNLIVNAAHAIADVVGAKPGEKGEIVVSTHRDGEWAEIRVRDTGTGIPEDAQSSIFNPFFTTKAVGKGTGQGLAIAHSVIVQKHGGSISFETETGVGTTFEIRLPIAGTPPDDTLPRKGDSPTAAFPQVPASA